MQEYSSERFQFPIRALRYIVSSLLGPGDVMMSSSINSQSVIKLLPIGWSSMSEGRRDVPSEPENTKSFTYVSLFDAKRLIVKFWIERSTEPILVVYTPAYRHKYRKLAACNGGIFVAMSSSWLRDGPRKRTYGDIYGGLCAMRVEISEFLIFWKRPDCGSSFKFWTAYLLVLYFHCILWNFPNNFFSYPNGIKLRSSYIVLIYVASNEAISKKKYGSELR